MNSRHQGLIACLRLDHVTRPSPQGYEKANFVTVRYWAAARAAAGVAEEQVEAATLADVLAEIGRRHGDRDRFADVVAMCSVLVGDTPVGSRDPAEVALPAGASVELLPPFAGG